MTMLGSKADSSPADRPLTGAVQKTHAPERDPWQDAPQAGDPFGSKGQTGTVDSDPYPF